MEILHKHKKSKFPVSVVVLICLIVIATGLYIGLKDASNKQKFDQEKLAEERSEEIEYKKAAEVEIPEPLDVSKVSVDLLEPADEEADTEIKEEPEEVTPEEVEEETTEEEEEIIVEPEPQVSAEINVIDGEITVMRGFEAVETNTLLEGDSISTKDNTHAKISFSDGSSMKLGPNSEVKINNLENSNETSFIHVYLVKGNLTNIVNNNDLNKIVRIDTSDLIAETFKSSFTVSKEKDGDTFVKVMKDPSNHNQVIVSGKYNNSYISQIILYELEQITLNKEKMRQSVEENKTLDLRKYVKSTEGEDVYSCIFG